ncbi:SSXT-like protein [Artemisia annua]|uniref:SSXT-like protein n=1 Tax=Artemisia annua TaxID=35608 RepID=A0A2U1N0U8_ARTAN|nr:SSXT-like protein [Artemisia annua]
MSHILQSNFAHVSAHNTTSITTDHIQQYLDENKALILNILENQNTGKFSECAENQTRLQHNLMYLAAIADCQPKQSPIHLQPYMNTMQQQQMQSQHMVPQSHMMAQSHTAYGQQLPFNLMQQQQHALQSQLGLGSTRASGSHTPLSGTSVEGEGSRAFPDFSQAFFGESSQAIGKQASRSVTEENRCTNSPEGIDENPQKKGKLTRAAT